MSLKLRLSRGGAKKRPYYRIVVADSRMPRDGRYIERVGTYNPMLPQEHPDRIKLNDERIKHWLGVGAKPSDRVARFLGQADIIPMPEIRETPKQSAPRASQTLPWRMALQAGASHHISRSHLRMRHDAHFGNGSPRLIHRKRSAPKASLVYLARVGAVGPHRHWDESWGSRLDDGVDYCVVARTWEREAHAPQLGWQRGGAHGRRHVVQDYRRLGKRGAAVAGEV